jgi:hypothetical protein
MSAEERFERIADDLLATQEVSRGTGFGATPGLRVGGKIFAMLVRGDLVVKLPRTRVDALVDAGAAERFDPRHDGRLMKEWAVVPPDSGQDWEALAAEALAFVSPG